MKFKSAADFKYYLYLSKAKLDMLYRQVAAQQIKKASLEWKIDIKAVAVTKKSETEEEVDDDDKLRLVTAELETRELVGGIEEDKPYIKGMVPMRWGMYNDSKLRPANEGPLVWFSGIENEILLGMGGSSCHVEGCYGATATGSRSVTPALVNFLRGGMDAGDTEQCRQIWKEPHDEDYELCSAMALANYYLRGPVQALEFVAKVLWRQRGYARIRPFMEDYGQAILATPLYVAQTEVLVEDDDNQGRGDYSTAME
ncbi:MAG TPA: SAVMC3_10250 family protein [Candidatus Sulfopaludibacter sp.]|jgi:hypothetical protein|nr:SAVMC3_10250 family protein [Candidatus Sulfopaludibacter sp.]